MANNRMYLKCRVCGGMCMLAKFYPSIGFIAGAKPGWFMPEPAERSIPERIGAFFAGHEHGKDSSEFGGYQYEMVYEVEEEPGNQ